MSLWIWLNVSLTLVFWFRGMMVEKVIIMVMVIPQIFEQLEELSYRKGTDNL